MFEQIGSSHILKLKDENLCYCLACKKNITEVLACQHLQCFKHEDSVRALFKLSAPDPCCDSRNVKYLDIINNSAFDVSWEIGSETSYVCKQRDHLFCLICQKSIHKFSGVDGKIDCSHLKSHLESELHLKNVIDKISWVYHLNGSSNFIYFCNSKVYCSVCRSYLESEASTVLQTAASHLQVEQEKLELKLIDDEVEAGYSEDDESEYDEFQNEYYENQKFLLPFDPLVTNPELFRLERSEEKKYDSFGRIESGGYIFEKKSNKKHECLSPVYITKENQGNDDDPACKNETGNKAKPICKINESTLLPTRKNEILAILTADKMSESKDAKSTNVILEINESAQTSPTNELFLLSADKQSEIEDSQFIKEIEKINESTLIHLKKENSIFNTGIENNHNNLNKLCKKIFIFRLNKAYIEQKENQLFCKVCDLSFDNNENGTFLKKHFYSFEHNSMLGINASNYVSMVMNDKSILVPHQDESLDKYFVVLNEIARDRKLMSHVIYMINNGKDFFCLLCKSVVPFTTCGKYVESHFFKSSHLNKTFDVNCSASKLKDELHFNITVEKENSQQFLPSVQTKNSFLDSIEKVANRTEFPEVVVINNKEVFKQEEAKLTTSSTSFNIDKGSEFFYDAGVTSNLGGMSVVERRQKRAFNDLKKRVLEVGINGNFISLRESKFYCELCKENVKFSETGFRLVKHCISSSHNKILIKNSTDYVLSIGGDSCITNKDENLDHFRCVLTEFAGRFQNKEVIFPHLLLISVKNDSFLCLLCNKTMRFSAESINGHMFTVLHRSNIVELNLKKMFLNENHRPSESNKKEELNSDPINLQVDKRFQNFVCNVGKNPQLCQESEKAQIESIGGTIRSNREFSMHTRVENKRSVFDRVSVNIHNSTAESLNDFSNIGFEKVKRSELLAAVFDNLSVNLRIHHKFILVEEDDFYCKLCKCYLLAGENTKLACNILEKHMIEKCHDKNQFKKTLVASQYGVIGYEQLENNNLFVVIKEMRIDRVIQKNNQFLGIKETKFFCSLCTPPLSDETCVEKNAEYCDVKHLVKHFESINHKKKLQQQQNLNSSFPLFSLKEAANVQTSTKLYGSSLHFDTSDCEFTENLFRNLTEKFVEIRVNCQFLKVKGSMSIFCVVCEETVVLNSDGTYLTSHCNSSFHNGVLSKVAADFVPSYGIDYLSFLNENSTKYQKNFVNLSKVCALQPHLKFVGLTVNKENFFCILCLEYFKFTKIKNRLKKHFWSNLHMEKMYALIYKSKPDLTKDQQSFVLDVSGLSSIKDSSVLESQENLKVDGMKAEETLCKKSNSSIESSQSDDFHSNVDTTHVHTNGNFKEEEVVSCPHCGELVEVWNKETEFSMQLHMQKHKTFSGKEVPKEFQDNADYICSVCQEPVVVFNKNFDLSVAYHFEHYHHDQSLTETECLKTEDKCVVPLDQMFDRLPNHLKDHINFVVEDKVNFFCRLCNCQLKSINNLTTGLEILTNHFTEFFHKSQYKLYLDDDSELDNEADTDSENFIEKSSDDHTVGESNNSPLGESNISPLGESNISPLGEGNIETMHNSLIYENKAVLNKDGVIPYYSFGLQSGIWDFELFFKSLLNHFATKYMPLRLSVVFFTARENKFFCNLCQICIKYDKNGSSLKRHCVSREHCEILERNADRYLSNLETHNVVESRPTTIINVQKYENVLAKLEESFPFNVLRFNLWFVDVEDNGFLCLLCNVSIIYSNPIKSGKAVKAHFTCERHRENIAKLNCTFIGAPMTNTETHLLKSAPFTSKTIPNTQTSATNFHNNDNLLKPDGAVDQAGAKPVDLPKGKARSRFEVHFILWILANENALVKQNITIIGEKFGYFYCKACDKLLMCSRAGKKLLNHLCEHHSKKCGQRQLNQSSKIFSKHSISSEADLNPHFHSVLSDTSNSKSQVKPHLTANNPTGLEKRSLDHVKQKPERFVKRSQIGPGKSRSSTEVQSLLEVHAKKHREIRENINVIEIRGNCLYCRVCDKIVICSRTGNTLLSHLTKNTHKQNMQLKASPYNS